MLDNTLSTDQYGLKRRRGQPWQADPFKISLPGEVDLMREVATHTQASDAV